MCRLYSTIVFILVWSLLVIVVSVVVSREDELFEELVYKFVEEYTRV